jgi:CheY-like chemotaxis protein
VIWQVDSRDVYLYLNADERLDDAGAGPILIFLTDGSRRTTLCDLLHVHGYPALTAESGDGFLERIHGEPRPALLLMDLPINEMTEGDFFAQDILIDYIGPIPLIVLSGLSDYIEQPVTTTLLPHPGGVAFLIKLVQTVLS